MESVGAEGEVRPVSIGQVGPQASWARRSGDTTTASMPRRRRPSSTGSSYRASAPPTGTLASFATFGAGFVARPIGGVVFGHSGGRIGRKSMPVITLLLMGGATFLKGYRISGERKPAAICG